MGVTKFGVITLLDVLWLTISSHAVAASAEMRDANGNSVGLVTLVQTPTGVLLRVELQGLSAGGHGFHVHETGSCSPDFKAAGGHFNPHGAGHGLNHGSGSHAGDMPNIFAAADGIVMAEVFNLKISLGDGDSSVFEANGSAIIIHAKPDAHGDAAGAGAHVACGVIKK